jgi:transposase-like protein
LNSTACILRPFFSEYKIECSDSIVGDETYIKIRGLWGYVFVVYDVAKSRVLSMYISLRREGRAALNAIYETIRKTGNGFSKFVSDANPIYQLAHQFLIPFYEHFIVRGLKDMDSTSALYRHFRQGIERFIRTYKQRYNRTHGFKSMDGAVVFNLLFGIYFNFMRPHEALDGQVPIQLKELQDASYPEASSRLIEKAICYSKDPKT